MRLHGGGTSMRVKISVACWVAVSLAVTLITAVPATAAPHNTARGQYYLSLGDSLAFGYQPDLVAAGDLNAADYRGYAEDFAVMRPRLTLVNYGCPGETTGTMLAGGCPWPGTLHDSYGGASSQAAAAFAFLRAHPGEVDLISIDIAPTTCSRSSTRAATPPTPRAASPQACRPPSPRSRPTTAG